MESRGTRIGLAVWTGLVLLFLWLPLALIMVYAFNKSNLPSWPIPGFTTQWVSDAGHPEGGRWGDGPMGERWCATPEGFERALWILHLQGTTGASGRYRGE